MWYVLQVKTGAEIKARDALADKGYLSLVPRENRMIRSGGKWINKEYTLFPSYLFISLVYTPEAYYEVIKNDSVIKFLGAPTPLSEMESEYIKELSGEGGKPIECSKVIETDKGIKIVSGALANFEGKLLRYNKRQKKAIIEVSICGQPKEVSLSVEFVKDEAAEE